MKLLVYTKIIEFIDNNKHGSSSMLKLKIIKRREIYLC